MWFLVSKTWVCQLLLVICVGIVPALSLEAARSPRRLGLSYSTGFEPWAGVIGKIEALDLLGVMTLAKTEAIGRDMSIDMGRSMTSVIADEEGVRLAASRALLATWDELKKISKKESRCYALYDDGSAPWHVTTMSATTNIPASLCPPLHEQGSPTIILGGFTMHRLSGDDMNPLEDTANKVRAVNIRRGDRVLDTCMGLGYTAIGAAQKTGQEGHVTTIEYDDASVEMCAHNPWSQALFDGSLPIEMLRGDSCELIQKFPSNYFNHIIHDPPARALCRKDLYGLQFYKELCRVLTSSGSVLHYIGNPCSKESGRLYSGVMARMKEAGFRSVTAEVSAFGVVARK
jgi:predicted methyltransferase